jgi:hypothetical protein
MNFFHLHPHMWDFLVRLAADAPSPYRVKINGIMQWLRDCGEIDPKQLALIKINADRLGRTVPSELLLAGEPRGDDRAPSQSAPQAMPDTTVVVADCSTASPRRSPQRRADCEPEHMTDYFTALCERLARLGSAPPPPPPPCPVPRSVGRPRTATGDRARLERRRPKDRKRYWSDDPMTVWCRQQLSRLRRCAKQAGVACDVTLDDLLFLIDDSDMTDPALDTRMQFGRGQGSGSHPDTPVCERVDQIRPFTRSNLIVISHRTRQTLAALSRDEVRKLSRFVTAIDVADRLHWLNNR